jgi:hypothetical protein
MRFYLTYGLPCAVVWTVYLLGLWPGVLTEDSIDQWKELTTLHVAGYHSRLQGLTNWGITRLAMSPGAVAGAQVLGLSAAYAAVLRSCARLGTPMWLIRITAVGVALAPPNGFLAVTLWKDVPYTIAFLFVVSSLMRLAAEPRAAFASLGWRVGFVVSLRCPSTVTTDCPSLLG